MKKKFLNIDEVCEYLTLSKSCIYKKVADKKIPFYKVGNRTIFDVEEITMWVKSDGTFEQNGAASYFNAKSFLD